jgi:LysM repeat protein
MSAAVWLPDVLVEAFRGMRGYQVDTVKGWRTRSAKTTSFDPRGVMNHHTGPGSYANLLSYMTNGSKIAPLCNVATSRPHDVGGISTVRITVCAAGRANHAGKGHVSWAGTDGGNRHSVGIENQNNGSQPWPKQQIEGIRIATAAILRHLGRDAKFMTDHKTYAPRRKPDMHSVDLATEQTAVTALLNGPEDAKVISHSIAPGETLYSIGRKYGVSHEKIQRANGITDADVTRLRVGRVLTVPRR